MRHRDAGVERGAACGGRAGGELHPYPPRDARRSDGCPALRGTLLCSRIRPLAGNSGASHVLTGDRCAGRRKVKLVDLWDAPELTQFHFALLFFVALAFLPSEELQLLQVTTTAGCLLVENQVVERNEVQGNTEKCACHAVWPRFSELNPAYAR